MKKGCSVSPERPFVAMTIASDAEKKATRRNFLDCCEAQIQPDSLAQSKVGGNKGTRKGPPRGKWGQGLKNPRIAR